MKVVLFCGGLGTRLREHSDTIPKPLVEIGYRPIIWHLMKTYAHYGHRDFVLCLGYRGDAIRDYFLNYNPFINTGNEQWKRKYISSPMGEKIKILPRVSTQAQLKQLFNHVDCGVFPSHAEGWNLEILELMACGARIIATDYSGHTEFLNKDNASLLDATGTESAQDDRWFHGQGNWCTYDVDQLVEAMRSFHKEKQSGNYKVSDEALKTTVDKFTWTKSIEKIEQVL